MPPPSTQCDKVTTNRLFFARQVLGLDYISTSLRRFHSNETALAKEDRIEPDFIRTSSVLINDINWELMRKVHQLFCGNFGEEARYHSFAGFAIPLNRSVIKGVVQRPGSLRKIHDLGAKRLIKAETRESAPSSCS